MAMHRSVFVVAVTVASVMVALGLAGQMRSFGGKTIGLHQQPTRIYHRWLRSLVNQKKRKRKRLATKKRNPWVSSSSSSSSRRSLQAGNGESYVAIEGPAETCWGSLIHVDMVLTAAQCASFFSFNDTVIIGYPETTVNHTIETLVPHPQFDFPYYDYLLIKLTTPVQNTPPRIISLDTTVPNAGDLVQAIVPEPTQIGVLPGDKEVAELEILSASSCRESYQTPIIDPLMICAKSTLDDTTNTTEGCRFDAGSPMVDADGFLIGILSSGAGGGCDRDPSPAIFSRVSFASDWIINVTCELSALPPVFCSSERMDSDQTTTSPLSDATPTNGRVSSMPEGIWTRLFGQLFHQD